jgi:hypothetical protein
MLLLLTQTASHLRHFNFIHPGGVERVSLLRQPADGSNMTSSSQVKSVRQVLLQGGKEKKIAGIKWAIVQHFSRPTFRSKFRVSSVLYGSLSWRGIVPSLRHFPSHIKRADPRASKFVTKQNRRRCSPSAQISRIT